MTSNDDREEERRTRDRHLWIHVLKRLHGELAPTGAGAAFLDEAFAFLVSAAELGSDVSSVAPAYLASGRALLERLDLLATDWATLDAGGVPGPEAWMGLAYVANIREVLRGDWRELYTSAPIPEDVRELGQSILARVEPLPFERGLQVLERSWKSVAADVRSEAAALLFIRACAMQGLYARPDLYAQLAEGLSLQRPFLAIYLTASCLKLEVVAARVDVSSWSQEQYACLMFLDTFQFLSGAGWG